MKKPLTDWIHLLFDSEEKVDSVLFRVDAGSQKGLSFGHAARCLTISQALTTRFCTKKLFLMRNLIEGVAFVEKAGEKVEKIPELSDPTKQFEKIEEIIDKEKIDWLVIDLPYNDVCDYPFALIRNKGVKILFLDDSRFCIPAEVDIFLNSSVLAPKKVKKTHHPCTRLFLGPNFFVFDASMLNSIPIREKDYFNIVVTLGGSDPMGLTEKIIDILLCEGNEDCFYSIILGPGFKETKTIKMKTEAANNFRTVIFPDNLYSYLHGSDLVICSGGRTLYEVVNLGKKCLPIASAYHETETIEEFFNKGLIQNGLSDWNPQTFISALNEIIRGCSCEV